MLSRRGDKYVLIHDVDEFENVANGIRRSIMREFESRAEKVNQKNQESFAELEQRLEYMNGKIIEQDEIIKRLKKERKEIK
jgi:TolA-binding protein